MHNFKVGDILNLNTNPTDAALIETKEGAFPRRVTSVSGEFVRFNGNSSGWTKAHFVKVGVEGAVGRDSPNAKADSQAGVVGPRGEKGLAGPRDMSYNKYNRPIIGFEGLVATVDVYRVLDAFKVTDPALQHLIKKALCVGIRGHKDSTTDYTDILKSAEKALNLHKQKQEA